MFSREDETFKLIIYIRLLLLLLHWQWHSLEEAFCSLLTNLRNNRHTSHTTTIRSTGSWVECAENILKSKTLRRSMWSQWNKIMRKVLWSPFGFWGWLLYTLHVFCSQHLGIIACYVTRGEISFPIHRKGCPLIHMDSTLYIRVLWLIYFVCVMCRGFHAESDVNTNKTLASLRLLMYSHTFGQYYSISTYSSSDFSSFISVAIHSQVVTTTS